VLVASAATAHIGGLVMEIDAVRGEASAAAAPLLA
jgi:hypothetical protein